ncbi:MAG: hypothetical protein ACFB16_11305 [Phormidesmis sp.]
MNSSQDQHNLYARYPDAVHLSDTYLQLEGFTQPQPEAESRPLTMADVVHETPHLAKGTWQDTAIAFGVIFTVLITSSVALGYGASKLTSGIQQMARQMNQQTETITTATSWRF